MHYDKDEELATSFGVGAFPQLSTVTYINVPINSAPTVIVPTLASNEIGSLISHCYLSLPKSGKHIVFDGRLLHGAPGQLSYLNKSSESVSTVSNLSNIRITLLVNIWMNYQPVGVNPLSEGLLNSLPSASAGINLMSHSILNIGDESSPPAVINLSSRETDNENIGDWQIIPFISDKSEWGKSEDESGISLYIWLPNENSPVISNVKSIGNISTIVFRYTDSNSAARLDYDFDDEEMVEDVICVTINN